MVPERGLDDLRLNVTFGFIWSRFEVPVYWWEVVEFCGRKLPLTLISVFIDDVVLKCVVGILTVGCVIAANFAFAPYVKRTYDLLDQMTSVGEVMILLFGLLASYRQATTQLKVATSGAGATSSAISIFDEAGITDRMLIIYVCFTFFFLGVSLRFRTVPLFLSGVSIVWSIV